MENPGQLLEQEWISKIAQNPLYVAIITAILTIILLPFLKWMGKRLWESLQKFIQNLSRHKRFLRDYINWTIHANKYISVLPSGLAAVKSGTLHLMELDEIYISLTMSQGEDAGKPRSLDDLLKKNKRVIILGDPGAGKSTMMQYLTLQSAYQLSGKKDKLSLQVEKRIPVLIRLNKFHDIKEWEANRDLLSAMKAEIEANLGRTIPEGFFEKKLQEGKVLILLDAFDELASKETRQLLAEKVKNFAALYQENRFIVTSRITGYNNQLADAGFENPFTVQKLTSTHIRNFIFKWYENLARLQSVDKTPDEKAYLSKQYQQRGQTLVEVIFSNERIRQLAINPMLLSLITLVHYVKVQLPDQRHLLYRECVDILIEQWDSVKNVQFPLLDKFSVNEKKQILQRIAWYMQENHMKSISKTEVVGKVLMGACREIGGEKIKENEVEKFLNIVEERTGLLVEKGFNEQGLPEVSFSHLTFQEYLASLELFSSQGGEAAVFEQILKFVESDSDWWQEVALLTLSQFKNPLAYQEKLHQKLFQLV